MATYKGTDGNDTLTGGSDDDTFYPRLGVDQVDGRGGVNQLVVNYAAQTAGDTNSIVTDGGDHFNGVLTSGANSTTFYNIEALNYYAGSGDDSLNIDGTPLGAGATVHLDGGAGTDSLSLQLAGLQDNTFIAQQSGKVVSNVGTFTNWENYHIELGGGTNRIVTQGGTDYIQGHGGIDTVNTGGGDDTMLFDSTTGTFDGGDGTDSWSDTFASSNANLTFKDSNDHISNGTTFKNMEDYGITAGGGDDTFNISTAQSGTVVGGAGHDTLNVDATANSLTSYSGIGPGAEGNDFQGYLNTGGHFSFYQVEKMTFDAGSGTDFISVNAAPVLQGAHLSVDGGAARDYLQLDLSAFAHASFLDNGDGTVTSNAGTYTNFEVYDITLSGGRNYITAGSGDDTIRADGGSDRLDGGAGFDTLFADFSGSSDRIVFEATGDGVVLTNRGSYSDFESYRITGGAGDDTIGGGSQDDVLNGGTGANAVTYAYATSGVTVSLGSTAAQDTGGAGTDTLSNFGELIGSDHDDTLTASATGSILRGGLGDDVLIGGAGADRLIGGAGADVMTGGGGADQFNFISLADFATGATLDRITDFSHAQGDKIALTTIDPDAAAAGDQAFTFIGTAAFTGAGGAAYEVRDQNNMDGSYTVFGDTNHDGVADFNFLVVSPTALVGSDFQL